MRRVRVTAGREKDENPLLIPSHGAGFPNIYPNGSNGMHNLRLSKVHSSGGLQFCLIRRTLRRELLVRTNAAPSFKGR